MFHKMLPVTNSEQEAANKVNLFSQQNIDVRQDLDIWGADSGFLKPHTPPSIVMTEGINACPHVEVVDDPEGRSRP
jgi:hypothetical protein